MSHEVMSTALLVAFPPDRARTCLPREITVIRYAQNGLTVIEETRAATTEIGTVFSRPPPLRRCLHPWQL